MATTIQLKRSTTTGSEPVANDLTVGELAVNTADGKLFTKHSDNSIVTITGSGGGTSDQATKVIVTVDNKSGSTLNKGAPVYITGATGNTFHVDAARADSEGMMPASGILSQQLAADSEGSMIVTGFVNGIDTSGFSPGDEIFVGATGGYTNSAPASEANLIQKLGTVSKVDNSNGAILLQGAGRSNAVPNLDNDQFFLGNSSNKAVATDFSTAVEAISINNVVEDTTPQLGGTLDANGNSIDMGTNTITDTAVGQWNAAYDHYVSFDDTVRISWNLGNESTYPIYYKVAEVNKGNGGLHIKGSLANHVESFGTQDFDLTVYGREADSGANIEVSGQFNVAASGVGIKIVKATSGQTYERYDVYVVATRYTQGHVDLTISGATTISSYSGTITSSSSGTTTSPTGHAVELDTSSSSYTEGFYSVINSAVQRLDANATTSANGLMSSTDKSKLDGIESGATGDQSASEILTAIKTVDGAGSGLDADLFDGQQSTSFLRSNASDTFDANQTLTFGSGSRLAGGSGSLDGFFMPQNPEGKHIRNPFFFNDIAYARLRGATVTVDIDGTAMTSTSSIDDMLNANTDFWNFATAGATTVTITITNSPKNLTYGSYMGVTFGNTNWRAKDVTFEAYYNSQWNQIHSVTNQSEEFVIDYYNSSNTPTTGFRWTFENFNTTSMRIVSLFAYNYNSSGMEGLYVTRDGGTIHNGITVNGNIATTGTVDGRDVAADGTKLDGIETNATADQTASEILTAIKTVDGASSGLDADLLDGVQGSSYLRSDTSDTFTGNLTLNGNLSIKDSTNSYTLDTSSSDLILTAGQNGVFWYKGFDSASNVDGRAEFIIGNGSYDFDDNADSKLLFRHYGYTSSSFVTLFSDETLGLIDFEAKHKETASGGDSTSSDVLMGRIRAATDYSGGTKVQYGNLELSSYTSTTTNGASNKSAGITLNNSGVTIDTGNLIVSSSNITANGNTVWHAGNDGSGSGLDADTLDGVQGSSFLRSDQADIKTGGTLTFNDSVLLGIGTSNDLLIFHNGATSLENRNGDFNLFNTADDKDVTIYTDNGSGGFTQYFKADGSTGESILYHYGTQKLATKATGISISGDVTVSGDLTVSGTTTTVNTETINLADNIITLNSNETGTPSQNAGIEIERGTSSNKSFYWDESNDRWYLDSNTNVNGLLSATTKSFIIDHPTKEGYKLRHGSLEGPENGVYVRGRAKDNIIMLPEYWKGLVDEESITVNITPINRDQGIYVESWDNERVILGGIAIDCFYTIYGERKDVDKFEVEYED